MNYKCKLHGLNYKENCFDCSLIQEIKKDLEVLLKRIEDLEKRPWWKTWGKK